MRYTDRRKAGEALAKKLADLRLADPVILGLARGGVVVAEPVAETLDTPFDVLVVRKLGVPWHPELGMGAIAEGGVRLINKDLVTRVGINDEEIERVTEIETRELNRRAELYRGGRDPLPLDGTTVIVDDGLATGFTARAAIESARRRGSTEVILAVPVGAAATVAELEELADRVVCPLQPRELGAVGAWYRDFAQTMDSEVVSILAAHA